MSGDRAVIEFFYDVASPYSYLASTQLDGLSERTGAEVRWRPFLLGAVFKATGNVAPARVPAKARWMLSDLADWAAAYGVPFAFPAHRFPINSLLPQRALTAAPEAAGPALARALFEAYWVRGDDPSAPAVIAEAAGSVGLDGEAVVAAAAEPEVKEALKEVTAEAVARGAFGAPTFFVGERMFWGNDRIGLIEALLTPDGAA